MGYEWDEEKRRINRGKHGIDFSAIEGFDWATSVTRQDSRHQEQRYIARGRFGTRLHVVVFTRRGQRYPHYQSAQGQFSRGNGL